MLFYFIRPNDFFEQEWCFWKTYLVRFFLSWTFAIAPYILLKAVYFSRVWFRSESVFESHMFISIWIQVRIGFWKMCMFIGRSESAFEIWTFIGSYNFQKEDQKLLFSSNIYLDITHIWNWYKDRSTCSLWLHRKPTRNM